MDNKVILLVEDNPRDEALTLRALKKSNIVNDVIVVRDGVEALDYLFGTGVHTGRDTTVLPQLVLLDVRPVHRKRRDFVGRIMAQIEVIRLRETRIPEEHNLAQARAPSWSARKNAASLWTVE